MDVEIRSLTEADWPQLWSFLVAMGTILEDPRWLLIGAASLDTILLGYAAGQDHGPHLRSGDVHRTARLHNLFVTPAARRPGVGRALMAQVALWAAGCARYLEWQAHGTRAPFYERLGYRGEPCPQPDYPTFEIDFHPPTSAAQ